jgi:PPOX class probable F420-dependent enzyme
MMNRAKNGCAVTPAVDGTDADGWIASNAVTQYLPPSLLPLLDSTAIAFVSTIGPSGAPQTTPLWFLWEADALHFSLVDGRQKLRNLRRDPRLSVVVVNPADPTWYVEFRGHVDELVPDPGLLLERKIAVKYTGDHVDIEPPGTARYAATVTVEKITSQLGH